MKNPVKTVLAAAILATVAPQVWAQSSVTLYGVLDEYLGYQSATVGGKNTALTVLGSNGLSTSRWGIRGSEDLGGGLKTNFVLEGGFDPSTGTQQNSFREFDRQAWVGLSGNDGEIRMGRQQTAMWYYSGKMDAFNSATYGSGYNNFANWVARIDNDIAYFTPKFDNTQVEFHYSMGGVAGDFASNTVWQAGGQTWQGPVYFAMAYLQAANQTHTNYVKEFMAGGNYNYGQGKIYLGFFRANEIISATTGNVLVSPGGKYEPGDSAVGNVPGNYHNTYSLSADYDINAFTTVGAGYTYIQDDSSLHNNADQFSVIASYDLSKATRLYAVASYLTNFNNAQYKMGDASTTTGTFLTPEAGHHETGFQLGIRHSF